MYRSRPLVDLLFCPSAGPHIRSFRLLDNDVLRFVWGCHNPNRGRSTRSLRIEPFACAKLLPPVNVACTQYLSRILQATN